MSTDRKPYPTGASDAEWEFPAPYLTLVRGDAPQRTYRLRDVFGAVRYVVKTGCQWDVLAHDLPPPSAVCRRARRWLAAGVFEAAAHDLRAILRLVDGRTLQSTPESGGRAGYDGAKKRDGSKARIAVGTLGHLLALKVAAANERERAQVAEPAARLQEVTGAAVEVAFVDQGYAGEAAAGGAAGSGIRPEVVKHAEANRGFVLLPRRWVVERSVARLGRFRRPARDYERPAEVPAGWHWLAYLTLLLPRLGLESAELALGPATPASPAAAGPPHAPSRPAPGCRPTARPNPEGDQA